MKWLQTTNRLQRVCNFAHLLKCSLQRFTENALTYKMLNIRTGNPSLIWARWSRLWKFKYGCYSIACIWWMSLLSWLCTDLSWLQSDNVRPGTGKCGELAEVGVENVHLAEDAGLLVRYSGRVEFTSVFWGKEVPTLPTGKPPAPPAQSVSF